MKLKKLLLLNPLVLSPLLASCGQSSAPRRVNIEFGTMIGMDEKAEGNSHLTRLCQSELASFVAAKKNFILLVHNSMQDTCTCYTEWHDNILVPYIKKHNLLVYVIDLSELKKDGVDNYGLKLFESSETLGIFSDGKLIHQENNSNEKNAWVTSIDEFSAWMDLRIKAPQMFYVNIDQLNGMYQSNKEFTIYFSRSSCSDCAFFESNDLKEYLSSHDGLEASYVLDCDVLGIRGYEEDGTVYWPSNSISASEGQKKAAEQWANFKVEYGLAWSETNASGYSTGMVPTLLHINPEGNGKKTGDVIDAALTVYNDTIDEETLTIADSYFTQERLAEAESTYFTYLSDSPIARANKIVKGQKVEPQGERTKSEWRHQEQQKWHKPIASAFLDWTIANK